MAYVTVTEMLKDAQRHAYAVGAFNAENMESIQGVVEAAEELKAPVIIQTTPSMIRYGSCGVYYGMVYALAQKSTVPIALHLDHGNSVELVKTALEAGYSSVMIDGSLLPFAENIALTKQVVGLCEKGRIGVEAELGSIGGKEDDTNVANAGYTNADEAKEFVQQTGVGSLAVSVGTAHGFYAKTPQLDLERLAQIQKCLAIPLVLHGASGLSDLAIQECVQRGICKVNFATELRTAYTQGVKQALQENPALYDPKEFGKLARQMVKEKVKERILVCGAQNKA